jgi:hypothetical protein
MLLQAPFDAVTEMKFKLANDWHLMHLGSWRGHVRNDQRESTWPYFAKMRWMSI